MRAQDSCLDAGRSGRVSEKKARWMGRAGLLAVLGVVAFVAGESQVPQYNGGLPGIEHNSSGMPGLPESANPRPDNNRILRDWARHEENLKRLKALNVERQKEMNAETGKLITLANEIKAEADKSSASGGGTGKKDSLSVLDLHKVEMIEKLAKSVREKMTATITVE